MTDRTTGGRDAAASELDAELARELSQLSARLKRPRRELLNEAVREYLDRHTDPTLGTDKPVPPPKGG
jgi:predicted transcriptional regulator